MFIMILFYVFCFLIHARLNFDFVRLDFLRIYIVSYNPP